MKFNEEHNRHKNLPIFRKAMEILAIVDALKADVKDRLDEEPHKESREMLDIQIIDMWTMASIIPVKISGAESAELYDMKMENASIIRTNARSLNTAIHGLEMFGYCEPDYFNALRDEIEEFRLLFVEWVASFDPWDYIIDKWGLFNPPGVSAHDHDPNDDIPFNPEDYFKSGDFVDPDDDKQ